MTALRVALIGGPMYDGLYSIFDGLDIEVVVQADHSALNHEVATRLAAGESLDLISTHGKYAPSQSPWLTPLDGLVPAAVLDSLSPGAVALCRSAEGTLLCVPRNVDLRVLWRDVEALPDAPTTWEDVEASGAAFGFPGVGSGLFGTFAELVVGAGAPLFDADGVFAPPVDESVAAVERLVRLSASAPTGSVEWGYDDVDSALRDGRVAIAAAWPGATAHLRAGPAGERLRASAYPAGPARAVTYSGAHAWAIPRTATQPDAALDLLLRLAGAEAGALEAGSGGVPAHLGAAAAAHATDPVEAERLRLVAAAAATDMLTYPPIERWPEIEDTGAEALHDALVGTRSSSEVVEALHTIGRKVAS